MKMLLVGDGLIFLGGAVTGFLVGWSALLRRLPQRAPNPRDTPPGREPLLTVTWAEAAEWQEPAPLSPLLLLQPSWVYGRPLMPTRRTENPWKALWYFDPKRRR